MNDFHRKGNVLIDGLLRQKTEILEHDPDISPQDRDLTIRHGSHFSAPHLDASRCGVDLLQDQLDKSRFTSATGAHQKYEITLIDTNADLLQTDVRLVIFRNVIKNDHSYDAPPIVRTYYYIIQYSWLFFNILKRITIK